MFNNFKIYFTGVWTLSAGIAGFSIADISTAYCYCSIQPSDNHFIISFLAAFVLPFFTIVTSYICIFIQLRRKMKQKQKMKQNSKKIEMVILDSPKEGKYSVTRLELHVYNWIGILLLRLIIRHVMPLKFTYD